MSVRFGSGPTARRCPVKGSLLGQDRGPLIERASVLHALSEQAPLLAQDHLDSSGTRPDLYGHARAA